GDGELLFCLVLADHVAIEEGLDLGRAWQAAVRRGRLLALLVLEDLLADADTLIANVGARVFRRRADELFHLLLSFVAEGAAQRFVRGESFHRHYPRPSLPGQAVTAAAIL